MVASNCLPLSISVVRVFEEGVFILYEFLLPDEMFDLAINPALRLYNVVSWLSFSQIAQYFYVIIN